MLFGKISIVAIAILLSFLNHSAGAQQCEKIQNMAIMYRHYACGANSKVLNFWASDLSLLENKEQAEYSASCRLGASANRPQNCGSRLRSAEDHAVLVFTFVSKKHFCNFTLPSKMKENLLRMRGYTLAAADSTGLQMIQVTGPRAFDHYFAETPPHGEVLVQCARNETSCTLDAVTEDGGYLFEINFIKSELANWQSLLTKAQSVASKCL
jgi:hypothetical protein